MDNHELASAQGKLEETIKVILMVHSEMAQRETGMSASFNQQIQSLQHQVSQFRREVSGIVSGASTQIAQEAREAVSPVAAEYDRAVSVTSARLQWANKTVWIWFGAASSILILVMLIGWRLLGYYGRELSAAKEELQRYEKAVPIVQAFYASDAVICGGRICSNDDPKGEQAGDKRQYRQAKPRPQK
ncbi:hypothetical protein VB151_18695 [Xanthomonas fragariae]|uniref:Relaxation protein n=1 Tax=Xanthomonas fragariae TaxID=48664 RepID=A0A1Y6H2N3_9XANT|nr:hypothetical protein [Xanthomonas fragariae]ENZ96763.1 hypothetical protein O1K_03071 [Xanthomonas fragariae LMG 25863]MDM7573944.1 hypothetical protein [Xanthomonas fragariae]MDM7583221.1 hypothetical protein [Xanthomonas fragariae]MEA5175528.1 hypothetical protein [Xanthomonas fragariae]MEA5188145.1 hypothetical protein [Xanthomonas fragariae]